MDVGELGLREIEWTSQGSGNVNGELTQTTSPHQHNTKLDRVSRKYPQLA